MLRLRNSWCKWTSLLSGLLSHSLLCLWCWRVKQRPVAIKTLLIFCLWSSGIEQKRVDLSTCWSSIFSHEFITPLLIVEVTHLLFISLLFIFSSLLIVLRVVFGIRFYKFWISWTEFTFWVFSSSLMRILFIVNHKFTLFIKNLIQVNFMVIKIVSHKVWSISVNYSKLLPSELLCFVIYVVPFNE